MKIPFLRKTKHEQDYDEKSSGRISNFAGNLGRFFSPEPQKEKVLRQEDFQGAGDVYYATVSAGYKVAQRFLWLLFILFVIFSLLFHYKDIVSQKDEILR